MKAGSNRFVWNMRYSEAESFDGMILWWASLNGPLAMPGKYKVRLTVGKESQEAEFEVLKQPTSPTTPEGYKEQFDFLRAVQEKVSEAHLTIKEIRSIREQMNGYTKRIKENPEMKDLVDKAKEIDKKMTAVEEALYQTKNRSGQDPLNFPIRLTNKLAHLNALADGEFPPTQQMYTVKEELAKAIDEQLSLFQIIKAQELPLFNQMVKQKAIDAIILEDTEASN